MSHGFRFAIAFTLWQEDPRDDAQAVDLGDGANLTKWGITQRWHPEVDVASLTVEGAISVYYQKYWLRSRADQLPIPLAVALFDGAVNHDVPVAVTLLQRAAGVTEDGVIGPVTLAATRNVPRILRLYCVRRAQRYAESPRFKDYGHHWMERLIENYAYAIGLPD
jgi:lysozyme family protein